MIISCCMKLLQIQADIRNGQNLMFYDKNVYECFSRLKTNFLCVFYHDPLPIKVRLIDITHVITGQTKTFLNRLAVPDLTQLLVEKLQSKTMIIFFNHFERLTDRSMQIYNQLNSQDNIHFICSFNINKSLNSEVYSFFKTFKLVNKDVYELKHKNEINVSYAVYAGISIYCIVLYLKTGFSLTSATMVIGGIWFALIIFRTLIYAGGRL